MANIKGSLLPLTSRAKNSILRFLAEKNPKTISNMNLKVYLIKKVKTV